MKHFPGNLQPSEERMGPRYDYTVDFLQKAASLQEEETGEPVSWPFIEEKYFTEAAKIVGIPDYRQRA